MTNTETLNKVIEVAEGKLVLVEWEDSFGVNCGWEDVEDILKDYRPCIIHSAGYLYERDNCVIIIPHKDMRNKEPQCLGAIAIPKRTIVKIKMM